MDLMSEKYEITIFWGRRITASNQVKSSLTPSFFIRSKGRGLVQFTSYTFVLLNIRRGIMECLRKDSISCRICKKKNRMWILDVLNLRWFKMFSHSDLKTIFTLVIVIAKWLVAVFSFAFGSMDSGLGQKFHRKPYFRTQ